MLVNVFISLAQVITIPLCLVGWCWSVGWGITLLNIASRFHLDLAAYPGHLELASHSSHLDLASHSDHLLSDRQLQYEEGLRVKQANNNMNLKKPEPEKLDVMSLEGQDSF